MTNRDMLADDKNLVNLIIKIQDNPTLIPDIMCKNCYKKAECANSNLCLVNDQEQINIWLGSTADMSFWG